MKKDCKIFLDTFIDCCDTNNRYKNYCINPQNITNTYSKIICKHYLDLYIKCCINKSK